MISVLYVDDEPELLDLGRSYLENAAQFSVDISFSAKEALGKIKNQTYDIIVSDYQMPEMDGISFLKTLRSQGNRIPFIIFTGRGREEVVIEALNNGADFYLQKGGDPKAQFTELEYKIRNAVQRRQIENKLIESERRYRNVVEDQTEFICRFTPDGKLTFVNDAYCRYFGLKREECIGKQHSVVIPPDDARQMKTHITSLTPENPVATIRHRSVMSSGEIRWQRWSDRAIFGENGTVKEYQSIGKDITRYKKAEAELEASYQQLAAAERELKHNFNELKKNELAIKEREEFLSNIFSSIQDGISVLDRNLTIIRVNKTMEQWCSSKMPLIGKKCFETYHGRNEPCEVCPVKTTLTTGQPAHEVKQVVNPRKENGWVEVFSFPMTDAKTGEISGIIEYIRDITERRRAEEAMRESEERYRTLAESAQDFIYIIDKNDRVAYINTYAVNQLGLQKQEIIGKPRSTFFPDEIAKRQWESIEKVFKTGTSIEVESNVPLPTCEIWQDTLLVPLKDSDGQVTSVMGISRDITRRKQAKRAI